MGEERSRFHEALAAILQAIVSTVHESGGSPSSIVCLAVQTTFGLKTEVYCSIENHLVTLGILNRENHYLTVNIDAARKVKLIA